MIYPASKQAMFIENGIIFEKSDIYIISQLSNFDNDADWWFNAIRLDSWWAKQSRRPITFTISLYYTKTVLFCRTTKLNVTQDYRCELQLWLPTWKSDIVLMSMCMWFQRQQSRSSLIARRIRIALYGVHHSMQ